MRIPLLLILLAALLPAQDTQRGSTRSPHGDIKIPCQGCHTTTSWRPIRAVPEFNHNSETGYPLRGKHEGVSCTDCHRSLEFGNVGDQCANCHADLHRRQFGSRCEECHTVRGWLGAVRSVQEHQNRFPLLGAHSAAQCESCHQQASSGIFTGLSTQCASCHLREYQAAKSPDHVAAELPLTCDNCHSFDLWQNARFDHAQFTAFPLEGVHAQISCESCHVGGFSQPVPTDCFGCHSDDFRATTSPNHEQAGFPTDCAGCHNAISWQGANFDHAAASGFALTGAHTSLDCSSCHTQGRFAGTARDCYGCHLSDFEKAANPVHTGGSFSTQCEDCHTTASWTGAAFDHSRTRFPLTGAHTSADCTQCHINGQFTGTSTECAACHLEDFNNTTAPNHSAAGMPKECELCHTTSQWTGAVFDHGAATQFALTGAHLTVDCAQCHVNNQFAGTPQDCAACHIEDFNNTTEPNHAAAGFPQNCVACHTTDQWEGAVFDHARTAFPLTGAHTAADCAQCHVNNVFAGTPQDCAACHLEEFRNTTDPNHAAAGFPQDCAVCHNTTQWRGATFDHNATSSFALTGAHVSVDCAQCHVNNVFAGTPQDCAACHIEAFNSTTDPNHVAAGFPQDCAVCHNTTQWSGATFDHNATSSFALTGAHVSVDCAQCHVNNVFAGTPQDCAACHIEAFNNTTDPNHVAAGFPQDCAVCHNTSQWSGATFNHNTATSFALTGAHVSVDCAQCHVNNVFAGTPQDCAACHIEEFNNTTDPNHMAAGFPQDCAICHDTSQWSGATFNHNTATSFALTGAHLSVDCAQCHVNNQYAGTPDACVGCHLDNYNATNDPNHAAAGFPTDCRVCHTTSQWSGATFDHNQTGFPLTGAHARQECESCHVGGRYQGLPSQCVDCHRNDYNATNDPNHAAAGFPTDCSICHSTNQWDGATFDHSRTRFPLTGAHSRQDCNACHSGGVYQGLSTNCASCHLDEYNGTNDPNHAAAGFPTDCSLCHSTSQWDGATFDHNQTSFRLTGAHVNTDCASCHVGGRYDGTPTDCYSCHQSEYQSVTNPNHQAAGFPTNCESCHTTSQWSGATFNHNFPIYSGPHRGVWTSCLDCHNNASNYSSFSCLNCHEHSQSAMDSQHSDIRNYVYESAACLSCHPNGEE